MNNIIDITKESKSLTLENKVIGIYTGGFKPPTSGHFNVLKQALEQRTDIDELIVFIGNKNRDNITANQSQDIWKIYKKYIDKPMSVIISPDSPIHSMFSFTKSNPQHNIISILGVREGNDQDFRDFNKKTYNNYKYFNLDTLLITTKNTVSGTKARNAFNHSLDEFVEYLPSFLNQKEINQIIQIMSTSNVELNEVQGYQIKYWALYAHIYDHLKDGDSKKIYKKLKSKYDGEQLQALEYFYNTYFKDSKKKLNEQATYSDDIDYQFYIKEVTQYMISQGYNIKPRPKVILVNNNKEIAKDFFGKTAYYLPEDKEIVIYTEGRHPKDIVRSYCHEMIHHIQNLEGRLGENITTTNTTQDNHLEEIEKEAYQKGNIIFRNWTDSITNHKNVQESKFATGTYLKLNEKDPLGLNAYTMELARLDEDPKEFYTIYCDMDGVLVDFNKGYKELTGIDIKNHYFSDSKQFWDPIKEAGSKFWEELDWMSDGKKLWNYIKPYTPKLLSSPSREQSSHKGKYLWAKQNIPGVELILKPAHEKKEFASSNSILIDDKGSNIKDWEDNGGIGILHKNTFKTIQELKNIGING